MDEQIPTNVAQWVLWVAPVLISAAGASWYFFTKIYYPGQAELQRKRHEEAQKQRDHERALAELTAKQQVESKRDEQEHRERAQSSALEAVLGVNTKLIEHLIEQGNGRSAQMIEKLTMMANSLIRMEGMISAVNRDWSRVDEVVGDIDIGLNRLDSMVTAILKKHNIEIPRDE